METECIKHFSAAKECQNVIKRHFSPFAKMKSRIIEREKKREGRCARVNNGPVVLNVNQLRVPPSPDPACVMLQLCFFRWHMRAHNLAVKSCSNLSVCSIAESRELLCHRGMEAGCNEAHFTDALLRFTYVGIVTDGLGP